MQAATKQAVTELGAVSDGLTVASISILAYMLGTWYMKDSDTVEHACSLVRSRSCFCQFTSNVVLIIVLCRPGALSQISLQPAYVFFLDASRAVSVGNGDSSAGLL